MHLLSGLLEGVPDGRRGRSAHLELSDHAVDTLDIGVDCTAVVSADRYREGRIQNVAGYVWPHIAEVALLPLG